MRWLTSVAKLLDQAAPHPAAGPGGAVLVVDATGRGHAICDLFVRTNPKVRVYYGPGSELISHDRIIPVPGMSLTEPGSVVDFLRRTAVGFTFVSSIDALSAGLVDVLASEGLPVIGPDRAAARLGTSTADGKEFCRRAGLPTARWSSFTDPAAAKAYVRTVPFSCVVKDDVPARSGDGAVACDSAEEAETAIDALAGRGGGFRVVVEERLDGVELSAFAMLDGEHYLLFPTTLDYTRSGNWDGGKNCDGIGSVSPHPAESAELRRELRRLLFGPMVAALRREELHFTGFAGLSLMMTRTGLRVLEIRACFGDPAAEAVLPGVQSDFVALCQAVLRRRLAGAVIRTDDLCRCAITLTQGCVDCEDPSVAPGWPDGEFSTGQAVSGPGEAAKAGRVYYAGIRHGQQGQPVTAGGRVLHVVGTGQSPLQARSRAYVAAGSIEFAGKRLRYDIGAPRDPEFETGTKAPGLRAPAPAPAAPEPDAHATGPEPGARVTGVRT